MINNTDTNKTHTILYNNKDLFEEARDISFDVETLSSFIQNNSVTTIEDLSEFIKNIEGLSHKVSRWGNKVHQKGLRNLITENEASILIDELENNRGSLEESIDIIND